MVIIDHFSTKRNHCAEVDSAKKIWQNETQTKNPARFKRVGGEGSEEVGLVWYR